MVQFINLPAFQASPLMDLSPIASAFERNRQREAQRVQAEQSRLMQQQQRNEEQRRFEINSKLERDKFGLQQAESAREARLAAAREGLLKAQAGYYRGRGGSTTETPPARPQFAMRENGELYLVGGGGADTLAGSGGGVGPPGFDPSRPAIMPVQAPMPNLAPDATPVTRADYDISYGDIGREAATVPGIVVDPRGNPSEFATRTLAGQRAVDAAPDRERFLEWKGVQDSCSAVFGKPPAGMAYDRSCKLVPLGSKSQAADQAERKDRAIANMKTQLDAAEKVMLSASGVGRAVGGALREGGVVGRFANNMLGLEQVAAAHDQYKEGILQTVYALSGKQTTNKEMEAFLSLYMPQAGESSELIKDKTRRLRLMLNTLQANVSKGLMYDNSEQGQRALLDAVRGAMSGSDPAKAPGAAPAGGAAPSDGWTTLPGGVRIREKPRG